MGGGVDESPTVVIDSGSHRIKAGFAKNDFPSTEFPTIIGFTGKDCWHAGEKRIGNRFSPHIPFLKTRRPNATDWDIMELIWEHTFDKELEVKSISETPVVMAGHLYGQRKNRSTVMEILIEKFQVPYVYVQDQAVLALFSTGRTSGTVLELGEGNAYTCAGKDGDFCIRSLAEQPVGTGKEITNYLARILPLPGVPAGSYSAHELTRKIKEKMSFVSPYSSIASSSAYWENEYYELPDGTGVKIGWHKSSCAEILFDPRVAGFSAQGIHELVYGSIQQSDPDIQPMLYQNIVVVGGTARLPNLQERLKAELKQLVPAGTRLKVVIPPECGFSSWMGGSIVGSLESSFRHEFTSKAAFREFGPDNVYN